MDNSRRSYDQQGSFRRSYNWKPPRDSKRANNRRSYGQEYSVRRSYDPKPPPGSSVPDWEKKFCKQVGSLDWKAFLYMKSSIYLYYDILKWDDKAGEDAFHSAKNRFWAKFNSMPCTEDLPDKDLYIDDIDWNCQIDEKLLLDLESECVADSGEKSETVIIVGDSMIPKSGWGTGWCTGWGDQEDKGWGGDHGGTGWGDQEDTVRCTGWGDQEDIQKDQRNQLEYNHGKTYWDNNNTLHLDKGDARRYDWDQFRYKKRESDFNCQKNRNSGSDGLFRKFDDAEVTRRSVGMPRYNASRFHGERHNSNSAGRNWNGINRDNYGWDPNNTGKKHLKGGGNWNASRPNTYQASDNARQRWNRKKPVS